MIERLLYLSALLTSIAAGPLAAAVQPAYETEVWEPGRQLVWAHPGEDGTLSDVSQWRHEDGSPATAPPDRNTDILLPAAESLYTVKGNRTDQVRHVTVDRNASLAGRHRDEIEIWGNAHLKDGGFAYYVSVRGDKHTFFKLDTSEFPTPENNKVVHHSSRHVNINQKCRGHIAHKLQICKYGNASVEFIGKFGISDEIMVQHGRVIVRDEFRYSGATGKGALEVFDGGILELQSGACVAPFIGSNRKSVYNVNIYRNGTLQAGSPERPLTSDARLLLGFVENDQPGRSGLYAAVGSLVRVFTTDPTKARLVISAISSDPEFYDGNGEPVGDPAVAAHGNTGIALQLAGDMDLNGVHFDYVSARGIGLAGGRQPEDWSNLTWGDHNAGEPEALFGDLAAKANVYYHSRSDERSEYGLTVRAVAEMEAYLEKKDPFRLHTLPPNVTGPSSKEDFRPALQVTTETGSPLSFAPVDDVFLQNGQPVNGGQLGVKPGNRVVFLKFEVSGASPDINGATLKLTENGDVGSGTLRVFKASHSKWSETSITTDNAPNKKVELDTFSGPVDAAQTVEFDVSSLITENGTYSFIIEMDRGGNDVAFGSKENKNYNFSTRPEAVIFNDPIEVTIETRTPGAKIRYTLDGTEPSKTSPVYEGPIPLNKTTRLTAMAHKPGVGFSPVFSTTYVFGRP